jgi:hypothetical protein
MISFLLGIVCLLVGWALGWAHAIYMGRANEVAMIDELVKLDLELIDMRARLAEYEKPKPIAQS